jgi:hypothetical protein
MAKTFEDLSKDAVKLTEARVKAESPSIKDTPRRRLAVFQVELAALLKENEVAYTAEELHKAAESYAFAPVKVEETAEVPLVEPAKADDIIKKFAKTDAN